MKNLIIVCVGGFGREVAWLVENINDINNQWNILGFLDDAPELQCKTVNSYPVLGAIDDAKKYSDSYFVCAAGNSVLRKKIVERLKQNIDDIKFATLIDPSVKKSSLVKIGDGTIICAESIITVNIQIGSHVIINLDCTVGHDAVLQDFVTVYPSVNISGATSIGEMTELGTGTQIIQGKNIGEQTIIGAGSVVVKDIPSKCTAVGCPAKPIKYLE